MWERAQVAVCLNNLALLYDDQGHYAEALGPEHPYVATSVENYAALLRETGRTGEADKMEARAKAIRVKRAKENK